MNNMSKIISTTFLTIGSTVFAQGFTINDLHKAIKNGDSTLIEKIVKNNPELINTKDDDGKTAIHHTAMLSIDYSSLDSFLKTRAHTTKTMLIFMQNDANIDIVDNDGKLAMAYALEGNNILAAGPLLHCFIDAKNNSASFLYFLKNQEIYYQCIEYMTYKLKQIYANSEHDSVEYWISYQLIDFAEKYLEFVQCIKNSLDYGSVDLIIRYVRLIIFEPYPESLELFNNKNR